MVREDVLDPSRADVLDLACAYAALREAVDKALIGIGFVPPEDPVRGVEVLAGMARPPEWPTCHGVSVAYDDTA